jgi:Ca2+-binding RTX toxin-like protein
MGRIALLLTSMALALLLASGVALAVNTIRCSPAQVCEGTEDADRLIGTESDDVMLGLGGRDRLRAGDSLDELYGNRGNDELHAGGWDDRLCGGPGDDILDGGPNSPFGGDSYYFSDGWGKDTITDSDSGLYVWFNGCIPRRLHPAVTKNLTIKLAPVRGPQVTDGINTVEWGRFRVEWLMGGSGDDHITGDGRGNILEGALGEDTIRSGAGSDTIYVDDNEPDQVDCGDGNDYVQFDEGLDTIAANCESGRP